MAKAPQSPKFKLTFRVFEKTPGHWTWQLVGPGRQIYAWSDNTYREPALCKAEIVLVQQYARDAKVITSKARANPEEGPPLLLALPRRPRPPRTGSK